MILDMKILIKPWELCFPPPTSSLLFSSLSGLAATELTFSFVYLFSLSTQVSLVSHMTSSTLLVGFLALLRIYSVFLDPVIFPVPISTTAFVSVSIIVPVSILSSYLVSTPIPFPPPHPSYSCVCV